MGLNSKNQQQQQLHHHHGLHCCHLINQSVSNWKQTEAGLFGLSFKVGTKTNLHISSPKLTSSIAALCFLAITLYFLGRPSKKPEYKSRCPSRLLISVTFCRRPAGLTPNWSRSVRETRRQSSRSVVHDTCTHWSSQTLKKQTSWPNRSPLALPARASKSNYRKNTQSKKKTQNIYNMMVDYFSMEWWLEHLEVIRETLGNYEAKRFSFEKNENKTDILVEFETMLLGWRYVHSPIYLDVSSPIWKFYSSRSERMGGGSIRVVCTNGRCMLGEEFRWHQPWRGKFLSPRPHPIRCFHRTEIFCSWSCLLCFDFVT